MGTRELFLVLGAIVLFGIITLSTNMTMINNQMNVWGNDFHSTSISLAQQFIEEAKTKHYDEVLVSDNTLPGKRTSNFSINLGPEGGESYPNFDDFDDYHNYTGFINTGETTNFRYMVSIKVRYVNEAHPDEILTNPSRCKRMEVTVFNEHMDVIQPITLNYITAYWGKSS